MNQTVLLVDDEPQVISSLKRTLKTEGYHLLTASNGEEGLSVLENNHVDLVLTDQRMPVMQGSAMLAQCRKSHPDLPAIVLSGHAELDDVVHAVNDGRIHAFMHKPWNRKDLIACLRDALAIQENKNTLDMQASGFDFAKEAQFIVNASGQICSGNQAFNQFKQSLNLPQDKAQDQLISVDELFRDVNQLKAFERLIETCHIHGQAQGGFRWKACSRPTKINIKLLQQKAETFYACQIIDDIEISIVKRELDRARQCDLASGLLNRQSFCKRANDTIKDLPHERYAIAVLKVPRAHSMQNSLGGKGYEHLQFQIAQRLQTKTRLAGKVSDHSFALLFGPYQSSQSLKDWSAELQAQFNESFEFGLHCIPVRPVIGIAVYSSAASSAEILIQQASYSANVDNDEQIQSWTQFITDIKQDENPCSAIVTCDHLLREEVIKAIENRQLVLHYQPQVAIDNGEIVGYEALVRWRRNQAQEMQAGEFIMHAERSGLMAALDEWVFSRALADRLDWSETELAGLKGSINLSAIQLENNQLHNTLERLLKRNAVDTNKMTLEITETSLIHPTEIVTNNIQMIRSLGFKLVLDDFGTGFSSLNLLGDLPIDGIKIDKSYVARIGKSLSYESIIRSLIVMTQEMGLHLVFEGVETIDQLEFISHYAPGADYQGFLFSKAISKKQFEDAFNNTRNLSNE